MTPEKTYPWTLPVSVRKMSRVIHLINVAHLKIQALYLLLLWCPEVRLTNRSRNLLANGFPRCFAWHCCARIASILYEVYCDDKSNIISLNKRMHTSAGVHWAKTAGYKVKVEASSNCSRHFWNFSTIRGIVGKLLDQLVWSGACVMYCLEFSRLREE